MLLGAVGNGVLAGIAQIAVVLIALDLFIVAFAIGGRVLPDRHPRTKDLSIEQINREFGEAARHGTFAPTRRG